MTFPLKRISNKIALEVIDIQDSSFGQQLEGVVDKIRIGLLQGDYPSYDHLIKTGYAKTLEQMIFNRTGLQMELIVSKNTAAILAFHVNKNSILMDTSLRDNNFTIKGQQEIIDKAYDKTGYVDTEKARVGGLFSTYKNKLFINFHTLVNEFKLSTAEIVAVILHEVGHAFYMCEFSDRLESTNQVLANVAKELLNKKEKNLQYIYRELKSIDDSVTQAVAEEIVNGNRVVAGYRLFKSLLNSISSQLSDATYDKTAFEQLADHFASKFGYGKHLIVALDKLEDYFGEKEKFNSTNFFGILYIAFEVMSTSILLIAAPIALFSFYVAIRSSMLIAIMRFSGEDMKDYGVDELKVRYKRIRATYIDTIKSHDIPKQDLKLMLESIYAIDNIIDSVSSEKTLANKLANLLFAKAKQVDESVRLQYLLEDLAFNDLFLRSAEFKTL